MALDIQPKHSKYVHEYVVTDQNNVTRQRDICSPQEI